MVIRSAKVLSVAAVAALALAACGGSGSASSSTSAAPTAAACDTLKIAFFGAQTGDAANLGINISQGGELAVSQYMATNPAVKVEYVKFDSQGDPAQAPALAQKVIQDDCIIGVAGPAFSGESKAADPIFDQAGLPTITPSATNPDLAKNGWKVFHRGVGNDALQGPAAAKVIKATGATSVAVIDDASEYGKGLADIVAGELGDLVKARESIDPKAQDFSSTVTKIKDAGATVVYYGGYYAEAGRLAKQIKDAGVSATLVSDDGVLDPGYVEAAGAAAEGTVVTCACAPIADVQGGPEFADAYKAAFGQDAGTYSAETYDLVNFFLAGIKAGNVDRASLLNYIKTNEWAGLTKTLKFDETGEIAGGSIYAYTYQADGTTKGALVE